ncbi:uncharacterized protein BX663DRAFT_231140 [Cokeromyces recurvatus]|uniref:uncharacterized protein n=1 Tax=Cokeromyces recurvatus TaxID=90255 RepID=UPI00221EA504|nr:uncharacterized protein BX663DRAFT_231140 [Cokeromyces recurvatus]KAI7898817.1 hypothetical protein BX663DRAFT_231140 [Cokeromyces recurvatus]
MPPIVLEVIPIYSDLKIDIVQSNFTNHKSVTFSVNQSLASVIFLEKNNMSEILNKVKQLKSIAEANHLSSKSDQSHEWVKVYSKLGGKFIQQKGKKEMI